MNPSRIFILRPVATTLLMAAILLAGAVAYHQLPVSALPQVDYPTIQVLTFFPGASPEVMASSVTAPLERQFGQMPGLKQMTSNSSGGGSVIVLQFSLNLSLDVAEQEVQAAINAAATFLPRDLPNPPVYSKVNPADAPILTLALTSETLPLSKVEDLADTRLAQKISQLPGVGYVSISGGQRPAVRIQANPTALAAYGLTLEDLRTAIAAANTNQAKGGFDGLAPVLGHRGQRSALYRPGVPAADRRLCQRRPGAALRPGRRRRQRRKRQAGGLDERCPGGHRQCPAAAGLQRHRSRRPHQKPAAAVAERPADRGPRLRADRPHHHHPRLRRGRANRADAGRGPGGAGDLPVSAQSPGHHHSQRGRAGLPGGLLRGHVSHGLQPEQPVAHGPHHLHGLRGG